MAAKRAYDLLRRRERPLEENRTLLVLVQAEAALAQGLQLAFVDRHAKDPLAHIDEREGVPSLVVSTGSPLDLLVCLAHAAAHLAGMAHDWRKLLQIEGFIG